MFDNYHCQLLGTQLTPPLSALVYRMYLKSLENFQKFFTSKQINLLYKHMPGRAWFLSLI
jgi:hypothetical protein